MKQRETDRLVLAKPANSQQHADRQIAPAIAVQRSPLDQVTCRLGDNSCAQAHASAFSRMAGGQRPAGNASLISLQRQYGNRYVQRVVGQARGDAGGYAEAVAPDVEEAIQRARGGGQPLHQDVRVQMERSFGADFGDVRIHSDGQADSLNRSLDARAFTTGRDIFFRRSEYRPGSSSGRELLAHELTHVVQQSGSLPLVAQSRRRLRPGRTYQQPVQARLMVGQPGDRYEQEASRVARSVVQQQSQSAPEEEEEESLQRAMAHGDEEEAQTRRQPDEEQGGRLPRSQAAGLLQRDLATPPPATPPAAQPDLTPAEIQAAMRFNRHRYDETNTRLIQDIVGTEPTGTWVEADIIAIAQLQEEYGLTKDGMVGPTSFRWLDNEVRQEGLDRTDENCLVAFNIDADSQNIVPSATGARMTRHFSMHAQFPSYCNCADFEYRQFIRGHFNIERGGATTDVGTWFANLPLGRLNAAWQEDGHTGVPSVNYGHRNRSSEADNRYLNDAGAVDMANGCRYEGDDTPGGNFTGWAGFVPTTGDTFDIDMRFRGEVRRRGRVIQTKYWTGPRSRFRLP